MTSLLSLALLVACNPDAGLTKFNAEPEAQITAPSDGSAVLEGTTVTLRGAASDPNHATGELLARWFVGTTEACTNTAPAADGTTTCDVLVPEGDTMSVRLEVLDPEGAAATAEATYTVTANAAPTANIASPVEDGVYYSDQIVILRATVDDAEDAADTLAVRWESNVDGQLGEVVPNSEGVVESFVNLSEGAHAVQVFVTDSAGNEGQDTVLIDVGPPNAAPDCVITAPVDGSSVEQGARVDIEGLATDVDVPSSTLQVAWFSDKDGALGTSTPDSDGSVGLSTSTLSADTHRLTMRVTDEVGAECTTSVVLTVGTPPALEVLTPVDGDVVNEGDDVDFLALVSDAEDRASDLNVTWESDLDGLLDTSTPDSTGEAGFLRSDLSWGEHALTVTATDSAGLYAVERLSFTVNGLPTAPVVSVSPSSPYGGDDLLVSIDAPGVDPEGDRLTYSYAWYQNGVLSSASTSATLPASATSRGDRWTVEVWASDGFGESPVASAGVTIGDSLPTIASVSLSPSTARTGDTLACVALGASDGDGDTVTLGYAWSVNGSTLLETGSTLSGSWFDKGDVVVCSVTPTAGSSTGTTLSSAPLTIDNTVPTLTSASISPASPRTGDTLACITAGWSDADGDADGTTYAWTVNGRAAGTGGSLVGGFVGGDVVACVATPFDGEDPGSPITASVTVGNTSPVLVSVSLSPSAPREGDTLTCSPGATTDADGTTSFTYTYGWRVNGSSISATTSTLSSASFDADDEVACVVTPNDGTSSGSAVTSNTVTVANTAPVLTSVSVSPSSPTETDTLTCVTGATSDADGDVVTLAYTWSVDGIVVVGATGSTLTGTSFDRGEDVTCTATPFDGAAYGTTLTATAVTVGNTAPSIASASISPASPTASSTLTCSYAGYADPDADPENVTYAWTVNGVAAGSSSTLAGSFVGGDVVTCVATPDDGTTSGASRSASVTVGNTSPVLASVSLSPATPREGDTLTCSPGLTTDADGTTSFTYSYAWRLNGSSIAATSSTLSSTFFDDGDTVACVVTPNDGTSSGSAVTSSTVTVANTAPVLASVSITPSSPTRSSTLTCTPSGASDADGDVVSYTYRWTVDGVASGTGATLTGPFLAGALVACTVTPTDGKDAGAEVTDTATVVSTAPVVTSVTLSPSTVRTNDTITANVVSSDVDGDTVSLAYTWYVNGSVVSGATSSSLSGVTSFSKGDVVYVSVTPSDASGAGTSVASSSVTVANTAPTAPGVEVAPDDALAGEALACTITTAGTDADGDVVTYTFAWDVDGAAYTGTSTATTSSVAAGETAADEAWTCTVTATDGTDSGGSAEDTVVIGSACNTGAITTEGGVDFVEVCGGTFQMGCTASQTPCNYTWDALHDVTLTNNFYVSETEVTRGQFTALMGYDPSSTTACVGSACPVGKINWHMAAAYANAVSTSAGLPSCYSCTGTGSSVTCTPPSDPYGCDGYRLLTDAEWEMAARCETDNRYAGSSTVNLVAWVEANSGGVGHAVGSLAPNACGIYDMSGNVWEWTTDRFGPATTTAVTDPVGPTSSVGDGRVTRGGGWATTSRPDSVGSEFARVSDRSANGPLDNFDFFGIRIGRTASASTPSWVTPADCTTVSGTSSTYLFCTNTRTWATAETMCTAWGGHLVTVDSRTEHDWINTQRGTLGLVGNYMWTGYTDAASEGTWRWVSGSSSSFIGWSSSEPNNGLGTVEEDCAAFRNDLAGWYDASCSNMNMAICER